MRVLVTGVSEGIGGAICSLVAKRPDAAIAMCVRKIREPVEKLAEALRRAGCEVLILEGDLRLVEGRFKQIICLNLHACPGRWTDAQPIEP